MPVVARLAPRTACNKSVNSEGEDDVERFAAKLGKELRGRLARLAARNRSINGCGREDDAERFVAKQHKKKEKAVTLVML